MADDTLVIPDSDDNDPALEPDSSIVAEDQDSVTDGTPDATKDADKAPDKAKDGKLDKRIRDTEAALKSRQAELTRVNQEIAAQKAVQAALEKLLESRKTDDAETEVDDYLSKDDWEEDFNETPAKGFKELMARERRLIVNLLNARDKDIESKIRELVDPERFDLRETMAELSKQDWFSQLPEKAKISAAKAWRESTGKSRKNATMEPPATEPDGSTRRIPQSRKSEADERREKAEEMAKRIFGAERNPEDDLYPVEEGRPQRRTA